MAKVELKFLDSLDNHSIKVVEDGGLISVISNTGFGDNDLCVCLDKSTAIKFAKTLRTEINKIQ